MSQRRQQPSRGRKGKTVITLKMAEAKAEKNPLYLARSVGGLNVIAEEGYELSQASPDTHALIAWGMLQSAEKLIRDGDPELAYVQYMRAATVYLDAIKRVDFAVLSNRAPAGDWREKATYAIENAEMLAETLTRRYKERSERFRNSLTSAGTSASTSATCPTCPR